MLLELSGEEAATLNEVLDEKRVNLAREINRTDHLDYKRELKAKERALDRITQWIAVPSGAESPAPKPDDERAVRDFFDRWLAASKAGDLATLLSMMGDDVVFLTPGREPFGKKEFVAIARGQRVDARGEIREVHVSGDWAWFSAHLTVGATTDGRAAQRSGDTLTVLRRAPGGRWVLVRDANLMTM